ncbi:MAG: Stp1/IreP family PP2C-type Ser/Thr phosphatase [Bdellovibrionales bacterium]|nr:Stp1/IreP family PP2C-type Ser/Thr phosphatase [Bdellovibrionales bacterium]
MRIEAFGSTDIGCKRKNNQDAILVDPALGLFAVADGMGGHKGGEVASKLALEEIRKVLLMGSVVDPKEVIEQMYEKASSRVFEESQENQKLRGMGTTLVLALLKGPQLFVGNVGDSRFYMFRDEQLWLLTEDHSLMNEQLKSGIIKDEDIETYDGKNIITRSVGYEKQVKCDVISRDIDSSESFLICSDGLHGLVTHDAMTELCNKYPVKDWPEVMIEAAKKAGGDDNISVVSISVLVD